jgi:hypothetical protein
MSPFRSRGYEWLDAAMGGMGHDFQVEHDPGASLVGDETKKIRRSQLQSPLKKQHQMSDRYPLVN